MQGVALAEVLAASGGTLVGALSPETFFPRVEPDPGKVRKGDLFAALPGERVDGHEFTVVAALHGAAAALVTRSWAVRLRELPLPLVIVDDAPLAALQRIAAARRQTLAATVVGITGSVGKTSTKEAVSAIAAQRFETYRSPGNRNNEIGLPLAILEADTEAEVVVLEMAGAHAPGEIELLADIAAPRVAVVTNVHPVHLERMGSIEAIADTKAELVDAVPTDGVAVLNGDDVRVRAMAQRCPGSVMTYGVSTASDVRAENVRLYGLDGCAFRLRLDDERVDVRLPLVGGHAVELALAGLAVGHVLGMALEEMLPGLQDPTIQPHPRRVAGAHGSLLLDDTYNASPPSVLSALQLLASAGATRKIVVLGDMLELGALAQQEHEAVGRAAASVADIVVTYGDLAAAIARASADAGGTIVVAFSPEQREALVEFLRREMRHGDLVLVKGSRVLRMEEFVDAVADVEPSPRKPTSGRPAPSA